MPEEPRHLCIAMAGPRAPRSWLESAPEPLDFYDLKGVIDTLLSGLQLADVAFAPAEHPTFRPGRVARLSVAGVEVGVLGEVHPTVCEEWHRGSLRLPGRVQPGKAPGDGRTTGADDACFDLSCRV